MQRSLGLVSSGLKRNGRGLEVYAASPEAPPFWARQVRASWGAPGLPNSGPSESGVPARAAYPCVPPAGTVEARGVLATGGSLPQSPHPAFRSPTEAEAIPPSRLTLPCLCVLGKTRGQTQPMISILCFSCSGILFVSTFSSKSSMDPEM